MSAEPDRENDPDPETMCGEEKNCLSFHPQHYSSLNFDYYRLLYRADGDMP